ncbi:hypothetical protein TNCV_3778301 [Trichonephila clavipes]|nr:hypothetical protein TNCV_3778301 [Trichonephila clavipes]
MPYSAEVSVINPYTGWAVRQDLLYNKILTPHIFYRKKTAGRVTVRAKVDVEIYPRVDQNMIGQVPWHG